MMKPRNSLSQEGGVGRRLVTDMLMSLSVSGRVIRMAGADGKTR
jgi:hypothetical protein